MGEEFFDGRLEFLIRHVFLGQKAAAARIGLDRAWAPAKLLRKSGVLRITRASFRVNIDRAGLWKRFDAGEAIVSKKNSAALARDECAQAVTARGSVGGHLCVRGESINRRTECGAHRFGDLGWNGHDANGQHELFLTSQTPPRALDHRHGMCGSPWIGPAGEWGALGGRAAVMIRLAGCYSRWSDGTYLWHTC